MLVNVFSLLPDRYNTYKRQVEEGLIKGVLLSDKPISNYVNFVFAPKISSVFENINGRFFRIRGIEIFNKGLNRWDDLEVYISHGLVCGYCTPKSKNFDPDVTKIRVENFNIEYLDNHELDSMKTFLDQSEIDLINPSDFYEVYLEGKEYYHIRDLEDGDFIGIDKEKNVYKITVDPFEIRPLEGGIVKNLSKY